MPPETHALCTSWCGRIWNDLDRVRHVVFASGQCTTSKLKVNFNKYYCSTYQRSKKTFSQRLECFNTSSKARFAFDECLCFSKIVFNFGSIFQMHQPLPSRVPQLVLRPMYLHTHTQTGIIHMTHILYSSQLHDMLPLFKVKCFKGIRRVKFRIHLWFQTNLNFDFCQWIFKQIPFLPMIFWHLLSASSFFTTYAPKLWGCDLGFQTKCDF